jgi:tetratricopeptide (TPR) repeat protein
MTDRPSRVPLGRLAKRIALGAGLVVVVGLPLAVAAPAKTSDSPRSSTSGAPSSAGPASADPFAADPSGADPAGAADPAADPGASDPAADPAASDELGLDEPLLDGPADAGSAVNPVDELDQARADASFWAARFTISPGDVVAAVQLAQADLADARLTGDVTAYVRAEDAVGAALKAQPDYAPALTMRASILVSLHQFADARDLAKSILARVPDDPTALGVLGDASLELGDLETASSSYRQLVAVSDGSAAQVRIGRLALITGDATGALVADRKAASDAIDEGLVGTPLGFYDVTLGDALLLTGDEPGARDAYQAGLDARTDLPAALVGLARIDAFDGRLDDAIAKLDTAIAAIPLPDWLARRSDLEALRAGTGDADRAAADRATIDAIAQLAGSAGYLYDRVTSLYLSDHGLDPARAVKLASDELETRKDVYGYDALAWALLNANRAAEADAPMRSALASGAADPKLWYHAGLIAVANGRPAEAKANLNRALALGPALDPLSRSRAQAALATLP